MAANKSMIRGLSVPVFFFPAYGRLFGVKAAIMLQVLACESPSGQWVEKSFKDWERDTSLSQREQTTAREKLRKAGVFEEKYLRLDHRMLYRVNWTNLCALVEAGA
jgi:hypothetical protein